jgi:hypothetical protein
MSKMAHDQVQEQKELGIGSNIIYREVGRVMVILDDIKAFLERKRI